MHLDKGQVCYFVLAIRPGRVKLIAMRVLRKNKKGFSLVEIMIAVSIIGIMAGLAIPSFQRYVYKAKQGEGKANLSMLYTSMKTYFANFGQYTSRFDSIGYKPSGDLTYVVGFSADFPPINGPLGKGTCIVTATGGTAPAVPDCTWPKNPNPWTNAQSALIAAGGGFPVAAVTTATCFKAFGLAMLNGVTPDSLSIDCSKTMTNNNGLGL